MKRRNFIKTGLCLGCAGLIGTLGYKNLIYKPSNNFINKNIEDFFNPNYIPENIRLDICNLCQLNCVECNVRKQEEDIKKYNGGFGYVKFETFKNFIDKHPFIKKIELSNNGEIFLNPDLDKIIEYAYLKNVKLTAYNGVNLNYLPDKVAEALVKYQFGGMNISIDGATPETYAIYRRKGDFNKVINNIKLINKYKKQYNSEAPRLVYKFIVFGHNEHEIEDVKKLAKELNIEYEFAINWAIDYSPLKNPKRVQELTGLTDFNKPLTLVYNDYKKNNQWFPCVELFNHPQINWNGDFLGCCMLMIDNFKINVFKEGLVKTLHNEKILYTKRMLTDISIPSREDIPCSKCDVYKFLKSNNLSLS